jgi:hypothetical protein
VKARGKTAAPLPHGPVPSPGAGSSRERRPKPAWICLGDWVRRQRVLMPIAAAKLGRPRVARALAQGSRQLLALAVLAAVAFTSLFSGRSYLWCIPMQQVELLCEDEASDRSPEPSVREACCERHTIGELPRAERRPALPAIPPAPHVILASAPVPAAVHAYGPSHLVSTPRIFARHAPTRAGPPTSAERCVALQVFRC